MNTQPPEQNPNDYDEVTRLRLQLHHAETQRDAFAAGLKTDVLKIAKVAIYQASIDAGKAADADAMGCMAVELDDVKAENARLKADLTDLKAKADQSEAEVERLESDLKLEKENEDRLVRLWQTANNEVHGQATQIAALIDNQTSLKAEVERLQSIHSIDSIGIEQLKAEVERLTADLNNMTKTPEGVHYVEVDVGFWTKSGSRLPSSYRTFWSNDKGVQS